MTIFLSYNHKSAKDVVHKIADYFETDNYKIWIDRNEINVGKSLPIEMENGIRASSAVICFITQKYIDSPNCRLEFFYAANKGKKCYYIVLEKIEEDKTKGFDMYLCGEALRLDAYKHPFELKLNNIDENAIKNLYENIKTILTDSVRTIDNEIILGKIPIQRDMNFIGRENVLREIEANINQNKIVVLTGI